MTHFEFVDDWKCCQLDNFNIPGLLRIGYFHLKHKLNFVLSVFHGAGQRRHMILVHERYIGVKVDEELYHLGVRGTCSAVSRGSCAIPNSVDVSPGFQQPSNYLHVVHQSRSDMERRASGFVFCRQLNAFLEERKYQRGIAVANGLEQGFPGE